MNLRNLSKNDTIIAPATAPGMGAIAVIRISGPQAIEYTKKFFKPFKSSKDLSKVASHTAHFGEIVQPNQEFKVDGLESEVRSSEKDVLDFELPTSNFQLDQYEVIDEVLINVFHEGKSFTGEETIEISCHGSTYITQKIIKLFVDAGVRAADAGEFTMRAYRNGKFDLSQAEAVADLIHSTSKASAQIALSQLKGGVSNQISDLRERLLNFASLIELELDFSEEDVEFADRSEFIALVGNIQNLIRQLMDSFSLGNAIKNGIPVAIVGEPNVGKSTLLNALLGEDRAIVSDIAGTTRDVIEDELNIDGVSYRFIDTAGIRETTDYVESKGIEKTFQKIKQARVVLHLLSAEEFEVCSSEFAVGSVDVETIVSKEIEALKQKFYQQYNDDKEVIFILNKIDLIQNGKSGYSGEISQKDAKRSELESMIGSSEELELVNPALKAQPQTGNSELGTSNFELLTLSAKSNNGVEKIKEKLASLVDLKQLDSGNIIISNARHYSSLKEANESLTNVLSAMEQGIPGDLLAIDIRSALHSLGEIVGEVTSDDLLKNIFGKFCIGK